MFGKRKSISVRKKLYKAVVRWLRIGDHMLFERPTNEIAHAVPVYHFYALVVDDARVLHLHIIVNTDASVVEIAPVVWALVPLGGCARVSC